MVPIFSGAGLIAKKPKKAIISAARMRGDRSSSIDAGRVSSPISGNELKFHFAEAASVDPTAFGSPATSSPHHLDSYHLFVVCR